MKDFFCKEVSAPPTKPQKEYEKGYQPQGGSEEFVGFINPD